jgi:hypothetical protein
MTPVTITTSPTTMLTIDSAMAASFHFHCMTKV